jgi:glutamate synthase domain-containing protein 1
MSVSQTSPLGWPEPQGLWHPSHEKDACGVGFIAHLKGKRSHDIVCENADDERPIWITAARAERIRLTGDGAGMLVQIPDKFLRKEDGEEGTSSFLPEEANPMAQVSSFISPEPSEREAAMQVFEHITREEGQKFIGWRTVPVKSEILGKTSGRYEPAHPPDLHRKESLRSPIARDFERVLFIIRRRVA